MDYKQKYLKYKNKYLKYSKILKGGMNQYQIEDGRRQVNPNSRAVTLDDLFNDTLNTYRIEQPDEQPDYVPMEIDGELPNHRLMDVDVIPFERPIESLLDLPFHHVNDETRNRVIGYFQAIIDTTESRPRAFGNHYHITPAMRNTIMNTEQIYSSIDVDRPGTYVNWYVFKNGTNIYLIYKSSSSTGWLPINYQDFIIDHN